MNQPPIKIGNQAEYDFDRAMFRWLNDHKVEAAHVLGGLFHALLCDHLSDRTRIKLGKGEASMLQKLEEFMHEEENRFEGAQPLPVDENRKVIWQGAANLHRRAHEQ